MERTNALFLFTVVAMIGYSSGLVCIGSQADIVFVLDSSGSVTPAGFDTMLQFVQNVSSALFIGPTFVRIGAVRYSDQGTLIFSLSQHSNTNDVKTALENIAYVKGSTRTDIGLSTMRQEFDSQRTARPGVPQIGVVITDGRSTDPTKTETEANGARADGVVLLAVGVGNTNDQELNVIANDPDSDYKFYAAQFDELAAIEVEILKRACTVSHGKLQSSFNSAGWRVNAGVLSLLLLSIGVFLY